MIVEKFLRHPNYTFPRFHSDQQPDGGYTLPDGQEAPIGKPLGGWVSCPGGAPDWEEWCCGENWGLDRLAYKQTYELDMTNILLIETGAQMEAFHAYYKKETYYRYNINWRDVAVSYDGIVITPYMWPYRLGLMRVDNRRHISHEISNWYYGWDCASGCIWNPDVLTLLSSGPNVYVPPHVPKRPLVLDETDE